MAQLSSFSNLPHSPVKAKEKFIHKRRQETLQEHGVLGIANQIQESHIKPIFS